MDDGQSLTPDFDQRPKTTFKKLIRHTIFFNSAVHKSEGARSERYFV